MIKTISVSSEIEVYIYMLQDLNKKFYNNYEDIRKDLLKEFEIDVKISDISKVYEPIMEEDALDMQLMYKNIME